MTRLAVRIVPRLPASVTVDAPLTVTRSGRNFHLGYATSGVQDAPITPDARVIAQKPDGELLSVSYADFTAGFIAASELADALATVVLRDGSAGMTGNLPMGNNRITSVADAIGPLDATNLAQVEAIAASVSGPAGPNKIYNPAMSVSQERGTTALDVTTGTAYAIDQWQARLSTTPGGTLRCQQVALVTPGGSQNRLRMTVQLADISLAAGDLYAIQQPIEGLAIADALYGTAGARQIVLRLGVRSSVAGTFGVSISNSANDRSYVAFFTIAAGEVGTDTEQKIIIPGDTAGTWLVDTGVGLRVRVCLAAGTTWHGTAGWQAGDFLTTVAQVNFMATGSATFDLFDVGLYVDPLATGIAPAFVCPNPADEQTRCMRYFRNVAANIRANATAGSQPFAVPATFVPPMRAQPTAGALVADAAASFTGTANISTATISALSPNGAAVQLTSAAAGDMFALGRLFTANARLA